MHALRRMLLEEALSVDAVRRAHQAERPVDDEGLDARPDLFIVVEQVLLGDAGFRPQQLVGTGQGHGRAPRFSRGGFGNARRARLRLVCRRIIRQIAGFGNDFFRRLVHRSSRLSPSAGAFFLLAVAAFLRGDDGLRAADLAVGFAGFAGFSFRGAHSRCRFRPDPRLFFSASNRLMTLDGLSRPPWPAPCVPAFLRA